MSGWQMHRTLFHFLRNVICGLDLLFKFTFSLRSKDQDNFRNLCIYQSLSFFSPDVTFSRLRRTHFLGNNPHSILT